MSRVNRQQRDSRKKNVRPTSTSSAQFRNGKIPANATPILAQEETCPAWVAPFFLFLFIGAPNIFAYVYQAVMF